MIIDSWQNIKSEIIKALKKYVISNSMNGKEDILRDSEEDDEITLVNSENVTGTK